MSERDPSSVSAAHVAMRLLRRANGPPIGLIVVNRSLMLDGTTPRQIFEMLVLESVLLAAVSVVVGGLLGGVIADRFDRRHR